MSDKNQKERAADLLWELKEMVLDPTFSLSIEHEQRGDGEVTQAFIGTKHKHAKIRIGRGELKNFR